MTLPACPVCGTTATSLTTDTEVREVYLDGVGSPNEPGRVPPGPTRQIVPGDSWTTFTPCGHRTPNRARAMTDRDEEDLVMVLAVWLCRVVHRTTDGGSCVSCHTKAEYVTAPAVMDALAHEYLR